MATILGKETIVAWVSGGNAMILFASGQESGFVRMPAVRNVLRAPKGIGAQETTIITIARLGCAHLKMNPPDHAHQSRLCVLLGSSGLDAVVLRVHGVPPVFVFCVKLASTLLPLGLPHSQYAKIAKPDHSRQRTELLPQTYATPAIAVSTPRRTLQQRAQHARQARTPQESAKSPAQPARQAPSP
eukprot:CAMPEP_0172155690 /NCGR_PEP_ID=MMETSP1050-20130122/2771_1 /TAXON_ID=233186 /ORGANISM="Cryptomonas curvata, Strain CCAP979/52" /LENGTH=185 /DNA_ID=CAMNT_0012824627 /DNA_START=170 /DNA_END=723 /DNA_ORIENTATION=+